MTSKSPQVSFIYADLHTLTINVLLIVRGKKMTRGAARSLGGIISACLTISCYAGLASPARSEGLPSASPPTQCAPLAALSLPRNVADGDNDAPPPLPDLKFRRLYAAYGRMTPHAAVVGARDDARHALENLQDPTCRTVLNDNQGAVGVLQAWAWVLVSARRSDSDGMGDRAGDDALLAMAARTLGFDDGGCKALAGCVLEAEIRLKDAEQAAPKDRPALRQSARAVAQSAIEKASGEAPSLDGVEAWMVLAEIDATGPDLDTDNVLSAYALLRSVRRTGNAPDALDDTRIVAAGDRFNRRMLPVYQHTADAVFAKAGTDNTRLVPALLALGEDARESQIETVLADACDPTATPFSVKELRANETMLYPIVGARRTYVLLGTLDKGWTLAPQLANGKSADTSAEAIEEDANLLVQSFTYTAQVTLSLPNGRYAENLGPGAWGAENAEHLYDAIFAPVQAARKWPEIAAAGTGQTRSGDTPVVIIFPDPVLRALPWAILHPKPASPDTAVVDYDFIIRRVAVATAPGLSYIHPPASSDSADRVLVTGSGGTPASPSCMAVGKTADDDLQQFSCDLATGPLRHHVLLGPVGKAFTEAGFSQALRAGGFSSVLIAAHATFAAEASFIVVQSDEGGVANMNIGQLSSDISATRLRAGTMKLLILLSCEGAREGASSLGLAGAAVRSGASTTLGALVKVRQGYPQYYLAAGADAGNSSWGGTGGDSSRFLENYFAGVGAAEALRRAQYHYLVTAPAKIEYEASDAVWPRDPLNHPAAWGALVIIGWWR